MGLQLTSTIQILIGHLEFLELVNLEYKSKMKLHLSVLSDEHWRRK